MLAPFGCELLAKAFPKAAGAETRHDIRDGSRDRIFCPSVVIVSRPDLGDDAMNPTRTGHSLRSTDQMPGLHQLVVALGDWRYRVERPFGSWPENCGFVTDVAVDARGHVFVGLRHDPLTQADDPRLIELDPAGNYLGAFGGNQIADMHLFTITPHGRMLIVDRDMHEIIITSPAGKRIGGLGGRGLPLQPFNHPSDVAVALSGDIYVSDGYAAHCIHRFAADGTCVGTFGGPGRNPGQFMEPHALWAFGDGRIAVVDRCNDRVQVFAGDGTLLDIWENFYRPVAIWGDAEGNAFISDSVPRLHCIGPKGERKGVCRPVLNGAHGISGTPAGDLFLAESNPSRVTRLVRLRDDAGVADHPLHQP
jgi:NHL repeat